MCGRYYFDINDKEIDEIVIELDKDLYGDINTAEICPSMIAPIITGQGVALAKWGFPKLNYKGMVINARAESLHERMTFKRLVNSNRCIIPASGFFEWDKKASGAGYKNKYFFRKTDSILYMAGLYDTFYDESRQLSLFNKAEEQLSYVIITVKANEYMDGIHDRMPLIFTKSEAERWLKGENINILISGNNAELVYSDSIKRLLF
ncbi:MAG TPA: SOS response-associated peptidase [Clostridiales bacterium]|nr:SOS response-associated peptidase [Clostridiales bacterium]